MNPENPQVAIDLLIYPKWIIPIEPAGVTLSDHALAINDGCIVDLLPCEKALKLYSPREELDL
ncbi:MAG: TRZ/ATZ family hydrolase, partial [Rugosibacter sp.]